MPQELTDLVNMSLGAARERDITWISVDQIR